MSFLSWPSQPYQPVGQVEFGKMVPENPQEVGPIEFYSQNEARIAALQAANNSVLSSIGNCFDKYCNRWRVLAIGCVSLAIGLPLLITKPTRGLVYASVFFTFWGAGCVFGSLRVIVSKCCRK